MERIPEEKIEKKEKPPVMYHAASIKGISVFHPSGNRTRSDEEGPRIFGSPSIAVASMFLLPEVNDSWSVSGVDKDKPFIVIGDEQRFRKLDKGGVIYSLPSNTFDFDEELGLREHEWTSEENVEPLAEFEIESALDCMIKNDVKVYFTDIETVKRINEAEEDDEKEAIVNGLQEYIG